MCSSYFHDKLHFIASNHLDSKANNFYTFSCTVKLLGVIFADPEVLELVTALMVKVIEEKAVVEVRILLCHVMFFLYFIA